MTDNRKNLTTLVSQKLKERDERIAALGNDLNEKGVALADYRIYFDGACSVAKAINMSNEDTKVLMAAQRANEAEMNLVEQQIDLAEALQESLSAP